MLHPRATHTKNKWAGLESLSLISRVRQIALSCGFPDYREPIVTEAGSRVVILVGERHD
jgi:hypothetical protein